VRCQIPAPELGELLGRDMNPLSDIGEFQLGKQIKESRLVSDIVWGTSGE
jgi:hypothetical protein